MQISPLRKFVRPLLAPLAPSTTQSGICWWPASGIVGVARGFGDAAHQTFYITTYTSLDRIRVRDARLR